MFSGLLTEEIFLLNPSAMEGTSKGPSLYRQLTDRHLNISQNDETIKKIFYM